MEWTLLRDLTEEQRRELVSIGRRRQFARGEVVCHEGDPADALHLVESGLLAVRVSLPSGDTTMINVLPPGSHFGELALLRDERTRTAAVTALEPTRTLVVTASAFARLRDVNPAVDRTLSILLGQRVAELSHTVLEVSYVGVDRRLVRRLDALVGDRAAPASIPLTQSQLAELTGGTRPTINQSLQRLAEQGIVRLGRGRVEVVDRQRLRARCAY